MRLLNTTTLQLSEFIEGRVPPYAILSHTWGDEEVLFQDLQGDPSAKAGWCKVQDACQLARSLGHLWIWIDTCCIDKSSSAELSEAINSMFRWYREATICYAYLADVPFSSSGPADYMAYLGGSRWFTRGWTLQELLAPRVVSFYSSDWRLIGPRAMLSRYLERITGIQAAYMESHQKNLALASVAERMSWASKRQTTRVEDIAYCLLGIFNINMPLIYGEREKAFQRLQQAILREIDDQTILAWGTGFVGRGRYDQPFGDPCPLLAKAPSAFKDCGDLVTCRGDDVEAKLEIRHDGVVISTPLLWDTQIHGGEIFNSWSMSKTVVLLAPLQCRRKSDFFNCVALILKSDYVDDISGCKMLRLGDLRLNRVSLGWYLVPRISWRPGALRSALIYFEAPAQRQRESLIYDAGCVIRTLPEGYEIKQIYHATEGYMAPKQILPILPAEAHGTSLPILVAISGPGLPSLALVLRYEYRPEGIELDGNSETRFDSPSVVFQYDLSRMSNRVVRLPDGFPLDQVAAVLEAEARENWDLMHPVGPPGRDEEVLRQSFLAFIDGSESQLKTHDGLSLKVTQDDAYGPHVFLVDLKDPDGENVSAEAVYKLEDCGLRPFRDELAFPD